MEPRPVLRSFGRDARAPTRVWARIYGDELGRLLAARHRGVVGHPRASARGRHAGADLRRAPARSRPGCARRPVGGAARPREDRQGGGGVGRADRGGHRREWSGPVARGRSGRFLHRLRLGSVDSAFGVVVAVVFALVFTWLIAVVLQQSPYSGLDRAVQQSRIVRALDAVLPPSPRCSPEWSASSLRAASPSSSPGSRPKRLRR